MEIRKRILTTCMLNHGLMGNPGSQFYLSFLSENLHILPETQSLVE